ncbi:MAG: DUF4139 domain-containing protein [Planctomycetes bacterium]|nr:DUF4139 domain-containing protein [Planctomycetota bacterium]
MTELVAAPPAAAVPAPGRATRVTLFEDRAEVSRSARATLLAGVQWVALAGVSPFVDDRSVQASVRAAGSPHGAEVLAARVLRRVHQEPTLGRGELEALELAEREARREGADAARALERAQEAEARALHLAEDWARAIARVPRQAGPERVLEAWAGAYAALDRSAAEALGAAVTARARAARAQEKAERAASRLALGRVERPRWEAVIEVQLRAAAAGEVEVEAVYRVPCALWRPEHLARLASGAGEAAGSVELVTWATAWQRTGEAWDDVEARFSTARPARAATPPALTEDRLVTRRKTEQEKKEIVVEAREEAIALAGLDRGARKVEEMPGMDDGGAPLVFEPRERVSLPSDGRPFRVEIVRATTKAEVVRVVYPERAPVAHVRATLTHAGKVPLLAGPVRLARGGSLVGRGRIGFVGTGEPFELGFGVDDGVRVRREFDDERETGALTGSQRLRRTVRLYLSNLSGDARRVLVTERVPVSELEAVKVSLTEATGWSMDAKDGFARMEVDLPARATRSLRLGYELRASAKVRLPF